MSEDEELVDAFWRYHDLSRGTRDDRLSADGYFWTWEAVQATISEHPAEALELIADLVRSAGSEDDVVYVGAGPLEDLVTQHGTSVVDRVDELARQDSRFRRHRFGGRSRITTSAAWPDRSPLAARTDLSATVDIPHEVPILVKQGERLEPRFLGTP